MYVWLPRLKVCEVFCFNWFAGYKVCGYYMAIKCRWLNLTTEVDTEMKPHHADDETRLLSSHYYRWTSVANYSDSNFTTCTLINL